MKKITEAEALREKIILLQQKQAADLQSLKTQLHDTYESLKPVNLIKTAFQEMISLDELKNTLISSITGLVTGYLSKKILVGETNNPFKKTLASVIEFIVASVVAKSTYRSASAETEQTD